MIYFALLYSLLFIICLVILQVFPRHTLSPTAYKFGLIILILMFSYVAYRYIPLRTDDLYRYYILIERMRRNTVKWAMTSSPYVYEPFSNLMFLCVARFTDNNAIFPTISVFAIYWLFFLQVKEKTNFVIGKSENLAILTFLSFNILLFSISGTRNTLAAMFFAYGLLSEKNRMTPKSFLLYIFSVCTHVALLPIVALRLFCEIFRGKRFNVIHVFMLFGMAFTGIIIKFISNQKLDKTNLYIRILLYKIYRYLTDVGFTKIDNRYVIAMLVLCLALLAIYLAESKKHKDVYTVFMGYLLCITVGCLAMPVIFERYVRVVYACMLPMIADLREERWVLKKIMMYIIMSLDIGMLCYQTVMFYTHYDLWFH